MSIKHGLEGTPTYDVWVNMIQRCTNPNVKNYKDYGERGIGVDPRWLTFANFVADMGERPTGLTLDREDNDKGYSPANCRWATRAVQMRNTRRNRWITHNGETLCLTAWAEREGVTHKAIQGRMARNGSPVIT